MPTDFLEVTELAGDEVSAEQVERMWHRYVWAGEYCRDRDVIEAACGTGQGLGYLAGLARGLTGGDYSQAMVDRAKAHYGDRVNVIRFDAQQMPFPDRTADVIMLFEAIYYLPSAEAFVKEARRVLRPGGRVLIATANKDLYDFNPSPYSHRYYGAADLTALFAAQGFRTELAGMTRVDALPLRQRLLRPVKSLAARFNLIPETMAGKKILKRLVFGGLVTMPAEITAEMFAYTEPEPVPTDCPDSVHKVLYCVATLNED
ncbi:MAG: class I SAM-dependent methyltransferase [Solirubrobacterales bacterium]